MKYLRIILLLFCLVLVLLLGTVKLLLTTEIGLQKLVRFAQHHTPGQLQIGGVQGSLNKQVSLQNIYYKNQNLIFSCKSLRISLQLLSIFRQGSVVFNSINLNSANITYISNPNEKNTKKFDIEKTLRKLSFITIQYADLEKINVNYNNKKIIIKKILLDKFANQSNFLLVSDVGTLNGTIIGAFEKNITWLLTLSGNHINARFVNPEFSSNIIFKVKTIGLLQYNKIHFKAWLENVSGTIRNYPLQGTGYVAYNEGNILFKQVKLSLASAKLAINGSMVQNVSELSWEANIPNLRQVLPNSAGALMSKGNLRTKDNHFNINAFIKTNNLVSTGFKINQANLNVQSSKLTTANVNGKLTDITYKNYHIQEITLKDTVNYVNKNLLQRFQVLINRKIQINGSLNLPQFMQQDINQQALLGDIQIANVKANTLYQNNDLPVTGGMISARLKLDGTVQQPSFGGLAQFQHGRLHLNNLGITLDNIQVSAELNNTKPLTIHGSVNSGQGRASIQGTVDFYNKAIPNLQLHISGENIQALNLKKYKLAISPQVVLNNNAEVINLSGTVSIPYLRVVTDYDMAITLPSEVTFIGRPNIKPSIPSQLGLNLKVIFSNDDYIAYKKLRANLSGQINVRQVPGGVPTGLGELHIVKGQYRVYNRLLNINDGRLIYVGNSLYNPGLNIEALKTVQNTNFISSWITSWFPKAAPDSSNNISVGASVKGTLNDPDITLISYPSMSQQDILSYLLTGSGSSSLGGSDGFSAVGALASGLNVLGENDDDDNSTLGGIGSLAGGLFSSIQALNFRLPLTKNLDIRTQTNWNDTGVDLNYSNEYE